MKLSHNIKKSDKKQGAVRAVTYLRVSTNKQSEGNGLEGQREMCKNEIDRKKMTFVGEYIDDAVSGTKVVESREGLKRLYNDSTKGLFDVVVVYKVDRLGRSMSIIVDLIDYFTKNNIKVISCMEKIDNTKASGIMTLQMFAVIAQYEKSTIVERLMLGREVVLQERGETGGSIPYGFKRITEGKQIIISEEEGLIVKKIFQDAKDGISMAKIAKNLNTMGVVKSRGKQWYASTVSTILSNQDKYEGKIRNNNTNFIRWPIILYNKVLADFIDYEEASFASQIKVALFLKNDEQITPQFISEFTSQFTSEIIEKNNWIIYKTYTENERNELIEDMKKKLFNFVIVKNISIFGQTLNIISNIFTHFLDNEIKLIMNDI